MNPAEHHEQRTRDHHSGQQLADEESEQKDAGSTQAKPSERVGGRWSENQGQNSDAQRDDDTVEDRPQNDMVLDHRFTVGRKGRIGWEELRWLREDIGLRFQRRSYHPI